MTEKDKNVDFICSKPRGIFKRIIFRLINPFLKEIKEQIDKDKKQLQNENKVVLNKVEIVCESIDDMLEKIRQLPGIMENVQNNNNEIKKISEIEINVQNNNAVLKNILENINSNNKIIEEMPKLIVNIQNNNEILKEIPDIIKNIQNNNEILEGMPNIIKNIQNNNEIIKKIPELIENTENNNMLLENMPYLMKMLSEHKTLLTEQRDISDMLSTKIYKLEQEKKGGIQDSKRSAGENNVLLNEKRNQRENENDYTDVDYFDFENYFRGSRQVIKENQKEYIKYFIGKEMVVDLGCGRGEFLELLRENQIKAVGIDTYEEFVIYCEQKGLNVVCEDALEYLNKLDKVGGIFAGQLIEHLETHQIILLCKLAYEKLEKGSYIVMETPNPTSLSIYTNAFYIDPSHVKPVHPLTMKYFLEKAGFQQINILYTTASKLPISIPKLINSGTKNLEEFNECMDIISDLLFGSQDYAIIAKK